MIYKNTSKQQPPQGTKIIWFKNGDAYIAQRFGDKYLTYIPGYCKILDPPDKWMIIPVPKPYTGYLKVKISDDEKLLTVDELEKQYPEGYQDLLKHMLSSKETFDKEK